jgi:aminoglycoside N3'-acetyltransferase
MVTRRYVLTDDSDLMSALRSTAIEHLEVNESRVIVIYRSAVLILITTEGHTTVARAFDVELCKQPVRDTDYTPAGLVDAFVDELCTHLDARCD